MDALKEFKKPFDLSLPFSMDMLDLEKSVSYLNAERGQVLIIPRALKAAKKAIHAAARAPRAFFESIYTEYNIAQLPGVDEWLTSSE